MEIKNLFVCLFLLVVFLFLTDNQTSQADDSCSVSGQVSTIAGNVDGLEDYHLQCSGDNYYFSVNSESGVTIEAGGSTAIIVEGGVGPYTWEINSDGYSCSSTSGVTIEGTLVGNRSNILYCDSGT